MKSTEFEALFREAFPKGECTRYKKGYYVKKGPRSKEAYIEGTPKQVAEQMGLVKTAKPATPRQQQLALDLEATTIAQKLVAGETVRTHRETLSSAIRFLSRRVGELVVQSLGTDGFGRELVWVAFHELDDLFDPRRNVAAWTGKGA